MRLFTVALIALMGAGLASPRAHAESTSKRLDNLNERLGKIEQILANQSLLDLAQHLDQVQAEVRQLRGKVEELENTTQQLKKQRAAPPPAPAPASPPPAAAVTPPPAPAAAPGATTAAVTTPPGAGTATPPERPPVEGDTVEQTVYAQAMDALKASSYSVAQVGFKDFVNNYPASPLAANAQYWLAKTYQMTSPPDYAGAAAAFKQLLQRWPDDRRAPDASLELAITLLDLKKIPEARALLTQITQKYPGTDAARKATDRLQRLH